MSNVDVDYETMDSGIKKLLGKESYGEPIRSKPPCVHISDGFVYDDNAVSTLLQCVKCGIQYEISKINTIINGNSI